MMDERKEALMRIVIGIVSGIILGIWGSIVKLLAILNWIIVIITGKKNKDLAEFCNIWNTQMYKFLRYMTFTTDERVFPFEELGKTLDKVK